MTTAADRDTPYSLVNKNPYATLARITHLLTMHEHIHAAPQPLINPPHGLLQMRLQIRRRRIEDVEAEALELDAVLGVGVDGGEPGGVEDLHERGDVVRGEERGVEDRGEGAEVERAGVRRGGGREDEVHRRAHGLHHFGREVVEADHGGCPLVVGDW